MKKLHSALIILILSLTVVCSSCEKLIPAKEFQPVRSFSVHMKAEKNEKVFEADVICNNYESIEIAFTYPEELNGFSLVSTSEGYSVNVFGIPDEISDYEINTDSLLNILIETIKLSVFTNHGLFVENGENIEASLTVDNIPVSVTFSQDGYLSGLNAESIGFYAQFQKIG